MLAETEPTSPCGVCGTPARPEARFCKACGSALRPPPSCPACSTDVPPTARFCPGCGARLVGARPAAGLEPASLASAGLEPASRPSAGLESVGRAGVSSAGEEAEVRTSEAGDEDPPDDDAELARREIARATGGGRPKGAPSIIPNLLLFVALLFVILVVIREMNEGKPKETSPFEGPPPMAAAADRPERPGPSASTPGAGAFTGTVDVGPAVGSPPSGTLFIIARIAGAPDRGPPIAVKRVDAPRFPLQFTIGPGDLMQPGLPFEGPFDVRARLDTDGNAMTKSPGDLVTSRATPATPGAMEVRLVLDERIE